MWHRLSPSPREQRRSRRILRAERLSFEWKRENSAKTAPKKIFAHVNRNKRLTAPILQLRHPSGSLINSDQVMAELLRTAFLGFFLEDEGSTPELQPRTQTNVADPLITELEIRRALDGLNPHKGACPDGLFPKVLKALNSHIAPVLARMFNLSLQTAHVPEDWRRAIVTPVAKSPHTTDPRQFRPISLTLIGRVNLDNSFEIKVSQLYNVVP